jgi:glycosyltransferase involved in cell wall biosynthesis
VPEIVTHGVDGWLVPPRDPAALAAALRCLLDDPALRATLARNGRVTVQERFSLSSYTSSMEKIWHAASCRVAE